MTSPIPAEDPLRDAAWFASQIGMSVDYVRHNTATLPHHKIGRLVRFDDHCIDELRRRTAVTPADPMRRTAASRARKASR